MGGKCIHILIFLGISSTISGDLFETPAACKFLPVQRISNLAAFFTMPIEIGNITEPIFVSSSLPIQYFFVDMHNYLPLLTTISRIICFIFVIVYYNFLFFITSKMQASGERRGVLHRRPRICMPNDLIEPVTFARCAFIFSLRNIALGGYLDTRRNIKILEHLRHDVWPETDIL